MDYETENDPYLIPGTGVFRNKLSISDRDELKHVEAQLTAVELAILEAAPLYGDYNLAHLQAIHRRVFGALYPWAGQLRSVEITKDDTQFAKSDALFGYGESIFDALHDEELLQGLRRDHFVERLAHYYSELNLLHPFREGNGRVLRAFIHSLARQAGWWVDWTELDPDANIEACIAAYHGDELPLGEMLAPLISEYDD